MTELRAPFPWFGGKRRVADVVWRAFGPNINNYVEPFAGSLAVLLGRPGGAGKIETVNDRDRYLANFWRAITCDPWGVAMWADGPVNEADLHARHKWLVNQSEFRERMHVDPDFYDVKIAGWWVWGLCQWIGGGWCVEPNNHKHPKLDGIGKGVHSDAGHSPRRRGANRVNEANRPELAGAGKGVHSENHRKLFAGDSRRGIHADGTTDRGRRQCEADWRKRPELDGTSAGKGVHSESAHSSDWQQRPHLSGDSAGMGVHSPKQQLPDLAVTTRNGMASGRGVHSAGGLSKFSPAGREALIRNDEALEAAGHDPVFGYTEEQVSAGALRGRPRPNLNGGQGVHAVHLPSLGNDRGIHGVSTSPGTFLHALRELTVPDAPPCFEWFAALSLRLRRTRVACGDWRRVLGPSVLGKGRNVGGRRPCAVFLDPPYAHEFRDPYLYSEDDAAISAQVREWALEHGDDPDLRIALCGYEGEHEMPSSWTTYAWKAARGYAAEGNKNRERERIWFSPHCLPLEAQRSLFDLPEASNA